MRPHHTSVTSCALRTWHVQSHTTAFLSAWQILDVDLSHDFRWFKTIQYFHRIAWKGHGIFGRDRSRVELRAYLPVSISWAVIVRATLNASYKGKCYFIFNSSSLFTFTIFLHIFRLHFNNSISPLSSLQTLWYALSHSPSNSWPLSSSIVIVCKYVFVHTSISPIITCQVHVMLFVCMFSELTVWYWTSNWCALP